MVRWRSRSHRWSAVPRARGDGPQLGVELARIYEVVSDPWRDDHLATAQRFRNAGADADAEREEMEARSLELVMDR